MRPEPDKKLNALRPSDTGSKSIEPQTGSHPLSGLSHTTNWGKISEAQSLNPDTTTSIPRRKTFVEVIKTALKSAEFWSGTGGAVVCIGSSLAGVVGHSLVTLKTLYNSIWPATQETNTSTTLAPDSWLRSGFIGMLRDLYRSPGLNMAASAAAFAVAAAQNFYDSATAVWQGLGLFLIGRLGLTYLANKNFQGERTNLWIGEKAWRSLWSVLPQGAKGVLLSPGLFFSAGNLRLIIGNLGNSFRDVISNATLLSQDKPILFYSLVLGSSLATASILKGLAPLVSGKKDNMPSGLSLYLSGGTSGVLGLVCLAQGNAAVGIANLIWAASNSMFGYKQSKLLKSSMPV